jgi:hypothetical protein
MKITLKRNEDQVELIKAMASKDKNVAYNAQLLLAKFIGGVIAEVISNAPVLSNLATTLTFLADDNPSIPLDLYYDISDEDYIRIWSQHNPGGLPTQLLTPPSAEMKFTTYVLESEVSFDRKHAARSRLDVISKSFTKLAQELLLQMERSSANIILGPLATASTNSLAHVLRSKTAGAFVPNDLNKLLVRGDRINSSWVGGTQVGPDSGITDLFVSPEIVGKIREMAFNAVSTDGNNLPGTDAFRDGIYRTAGVPSFYGVNIMKVKEFGVGKRFNTIFDTAAGSTDYICATGGRSGQFSGASEEILLGIDRTKDSFLRAVAVDSEFGSTLDLQPTDEYVRRQRKIGYFGQMEEGRMLIDTRWAQGMIV